MKTFSKITLAVATAALLSAAPLAEAEARPHDGWHGGGHGHHGGWGHGHRGGHRDWHRGDRGRGHRDGYYGAAFGLGALTGALLNRPYYSQPRYYAPRTVHYVPSYYAPPPRTVVIYR
jgi:hypothetical protein